MPPVVINLGTADDPRDAIHLAVQALAEGKLVVFPTETVYGVAASAMNEEAVQRLLDVKGRESGSPFALAIKSADDALDYVPTLPLLAQRLIRRCWPGPLTLVVNDDHPDSVVKRLPPSVQQAVCPTGTIGLRVPAHDAILSVLRLSVGPLVFSSANRSGQADPVTAEDAAESLGDDVQLILDGGRCQFAQSSSVVRVHEDDLTVLREGVFDEPSLRQRTGFMALIVCTGNTCRSPMGEVLLKQRIAKKLNCEINDLEGHGVTVQSAGVAAMSGSRASQEAVEAMRRRGLDLSQHCSQPLTDALIRDADIILTMTRLHREAIVAHIPQAASRTKLICLDDSDLSDPFGSSPEVYSQCADQISDQLAQWVEQLELGIS